MIAQGPKLPTSPEIRTTSSNMESDDSQPAPAVSNRNSTPSPLESLPPELLASIIEAGVGMSAWRPYRIEFLVLVSHVCRRWRTVALGTPSLWNEIYISRQHMEPERVAAYMERSSTMLLNVDLDWTSYSAAYSMALGDILSILLPSSYRWRRVSVTLGTGDGVRGLMAGLLSCPAPRLLSLEIIRDCGYTQMEPLIDSVSTASFFTNHAPSLTSLRIEGLSLPLPAISIVGLTTLHILDIPPSSSLDYAEFCSVIAKSPFLTQLTLEGACPTFEFDRHYATVDMPALISLSVISERIRDEDDIIYRILSVPALKSLQIRGLSRWKEFLSFLHAGSPKYPAVAMLEISDTTLDSINLDFFRSFPMVTHFATLVVNAKPFFQQWASLQKIVQPGGSALWPHLRTLTIDRGSTNVQVLQDIISSRLDMGIPIKKLRMTARCSDLFKATTLQWFQDRLNLEVFSGDSNVVDSIHSSEEDLYDWEDESQWNSDDDDDEDDDDDSLGFCSLGSGSDRD